jgi:hypothetical protein
MVNFGSAGGAALQPKTVQPPFSSKQSAWCGVEHPGQSTGSASSGTIAPRQ